jgi:hypothetical protein
MYVRYYVGSHRILTNKKIVPQHYSLYVVYLDRKLL